MRIQNWPITKRPKHKTTHAKTSKDRPKLKTARTQNSAKNKTTQGTKRPILSIHFYIVLTIPCSVVGTMYDGLFCALCTYVSCMILQYSIPGYDTYFYRQPRKSSVKLSKNTWFPRRGGKDLINCARITTSSPSMETSSSSSAINTRYAYMWSVFALYTLRISWYSKCLYIIMNSIFAWTWPKYTIFATFTVHTSRNFSTVGLFVPWGILYLGSFCAWPFCAVGHFELAPSWAWNVLFPVVFVPGSFRAWAVLCLDRFLMGRFACASIRILIRDKLEA